MRNKFLFFILLLNTLLCFGQTSKIVPVFPKIPQPFNLSEISEKTIAIPLEISAGSIQSIFMTPEYLFTVSLSSVSQFDFSGKFIRKIDCGDYISNTITGDIIKKELYIPVKRELIVYDFSGNYKKTYKLENISYGCFFYDNTLWIQSYKYLANSIFISYEISYLDLMTGKESFLPLKVQKGMEMGNFLAIYPGDFFIQKNSVFFSFQNKDNILYQIQKQEQKINTVLNLKIQFQNQKEESDKSMIVSKGLAGKYLFVDYIVEDQRYLYMEDTKTGKRFHIKIDKINNITSSDGITEDVFNSGKCTEIKLFNKEGYFYFIKSKESLNMKLIDGHPVKDGPVVFIVKTKE